MGRGSGTPGLIIFVCGMLGLIIAGVEQLAYDNSFVLDLFITEASQLPGLQIITIVIFLLVGGILGALSN